MATIPRDEKHFDLEVALQALEESRQPDGTILLGKYTAGFTEFCRFFELAGTLFGFVAKDLKDKIQILEHYLVKDPDHYGTVQGLIKYEVDNNLTVTRKSPSASRTLLRLHRAHEFIFAFMKELRESNESTKTATIAAEVYRRTLSKYHVWIIRKMASLAMYALPSRHQLILTMCTQDEATVFDLLDKLEIVGQPIYDDIQKLYEKHGLLDLP